MNKFILAALAACVATSVSAKPQQSQMVVTGNPSLPTWVESASRTVDSALERVNLLRSETGVTYVQFNCDEEGKPQNVKTLRTGRYTPNLDHVGRQAIRRIKTLHPMFDGAQPNQPIEAAIIIADNQQQLDRLLAQVSKRASEQNAKWAARGVPNTVVSLAVVSGF